MFYIEQLNACSIRNLTEFSIEPSPKLNFFYGPNASGKTSILECVYLLSRIKSFRSKRINDVITRGETKLNVFAKGKNNENSFSVGVEKGYGITKIRFDGEAIQTASEQAKLLPVYILTPDHHILYTGAINSSEIDGWEKRMCEEAMKIDEMRMSYLTDLNNLLNDLYIPKVLNGNASIKYLNESYAARDLKELLSKNRADDIKRGYTNFGPHRTDVSFSYETFNVAKHLSRGQTKLFSAALISSQIDKLRKSGKKSIVLVDDLDAELDKVSSIKLLGMLSQNNTQTFVSSLSPPEWVRQDKDVHGMFHVKHGNIKKVVE
jgi:DNA replication and repair protein RecF